MYSRKTAAEALGLFFMLTPMMALASGDGQLSTVLSHVQDMVQSTFFAGVSVISIAGVGYLTIFKQRFPMSVFISVVVGLAIIFASGTIPGMLGLTGI